MQNFLMSLEDVNVDRNSFRDWSELMRNPDWRIQARFTDRVLECVERLPALEKDIIRLYFFTNPPKKQEAIAEILGIAQQTVSHRLYSAFRRLKFMLAQPQIDIEKMRMDLSQMLRNKFTVDVFCDFSITSSQTITARNLGNVSQQRVCWHLNSGIGLLKLRNSVDALFYVEYFESLMRSRNILREVLAGRRKKVVISPEEQHYFSKAQEYAANA